MIFVQIHWEQQKNGCLVFVLEVTSSQIIIIQKQQQCCKFIFFIAIIHYIQNDTKIMHSMDEVIK